jgi:hypothetical protein
MALPSRNLVPRGAFVMQAQSGLVLTPEANRFLNSIVNNSNSAAAGSVTTAPGSGLQGGGQVADGISISIAPNGVTNAMIRQSGGTSVVGRFASSTGNVGDIQAVQDRVALQRQGNQLAFYPYVDVPSVVCDTLEITPAPTAEVIVATHTFRITLDGVEYKVPCVAA